MQYAVPHPPCFRLIGLVCAFLPFSSVISSTRNTRFTRQDTRLLSSKATKKRKKRNGCEEKGNERRRVRRVDTLLGVFTRRTRPGIRRKQALVASRDRPFHVNAYTFSSYMLPHRLSPVFDYRAQCLLSLGRTSSWKKPLDTIIWSPISRNPSTTTTPSGRKIRRDVTVTGKLAHETKLRRLRIFTNFRNFIIFFETHNPQYFLPY